MIDLTQFWRDNPQYDGLYKEQAFYPMVWQPLAANAIQQGADLTVGMDADFIVTNCYGSQTTSVTNAAYIATPLIVNLIYTGKGSRTVTNVPVEWSAFTGVSSNPRIYFAYPIVIPQATQFTAQATNPTGLAAANVWLNFHGIKVFPYRNPGTPLTNGRR